MQSQLEMLPLHKLHVAGQLREDGKGFALLEQRVHHSMAVAGAMSLPLLGCSLVLGLAPLPAALLIKAKTLLSLLLLPRWPLGLLEVGVLFLSQALGFCRRQLWAPLGSSL